MVNTRSWGSKEAPRWNLDIVDRLRMFPVTLNRNQRMTGSDMHYQPGLEIHMTLEGTGVMLVGQQALRQSPRSVLMFRGNIPHQMLSDSDYRRSVVCIQVDEAAELAADRLPLLHHLLDFSWIPHDGCIGFSVSPPQFHQLNALCHALEQELVKQQEGWERMAITIALQIVVNLQRSTLQAEGVTAIPGKGTMNALVQQCSDYVCKNLGKTLTLREAAKKFAASEEHLTRCFKKETGLSFYQYVLVQRIAAGRVHLSKSPDASVADIAEWVGFASPSAFSRQFKAMTGVTPSVFRQQSQHGLLLPEHGSQQ